MRSHRAIHNGVVDPEPGIAQTSASQQGIGLVSTTCEGKYQQAMPAEEQERLTVASICQPVQSRMASVEERLNLVIADAPSGMTEQLRHALKGGGKRIRPALTMLAGSSYHGDSESLVSMATAVELLHTATLVHDDTIDNALLRRSRLTLNRLWGSHDAVLLGDYLCAAAAYMTAETENTRVMELFAQALAAICSGAVSEHVARSHRSREEYFQTTGWKTASLFSIATESGAVLSRAPNKVVKSLKDYGYNLGMAFQIVDDIQDVMSDLSRGIVTLPAILLLESPENHLIEEMLSQNREEGLRLVTDMVHQSAVQEECHQIAEDFGQQACSALDPLPHNATYYSLVSLARYLTQHFPYQTET